MTHQPGLDPEASKFKALVDEIAAGVVAENAAAVDAEARFPRANIEALREVGLLGLVSAVEVGGHGQGLQAAAAVVERLAQECASTAMITMMHYCGTMVVEAHGNEQLRREIAAGRCLTTLAFSESGSRSRFWAPVSTATANGGKVTLDAKKQLITSAGECDGYVWSSRPTAGDGASTIWWVPSDAAGLSIPARYEGLGLRGNGSAPIHADGVVIPEDNRLGADGAGFDVMMGNVLPPFCLMGQAVSCGIMEGAIARTVGHVTGSKYDYSGDAIASFPQVRAKVATMRTKADMCRAFLQDGLTALETGRADAQLRVLQSKLVGAETALEVLDLAMRATGGAAYRKDIALERYFRDGRAASVMAPVTDALLDFIGKALCGMPLFG